MVGLSNVDNTADSAKVVSGPQLIALNQRELVITTSAPLRKDQSVLDNFTNLSIDPMEDLEVNNIQANGDLTVNTINSRTGTEVTVDCDLAVASILLVDTIGTRNASEITVKDNFTVGAPLVNKNLTVFGNLSLSGSLSGYSPFGVAGRIDGVTTSPAVITRKGERLLVITCVRKAGYAVGVYDGRWTTAHPDGANWIGMVSGEGNSYNETLGAPSTGFPSTSARFTALLRRLFSQPTSANETLIDCPFIFFVLK